MITLYIYDNLVNGKVYIGRTKRNLKRRDYEHCSRGNDSMLIDRAIKKYGRSSFSLNVITTVETKERADYAETDWIARARELLGKDNVYNIADGGNTVISISMPRSQAVKDKISASSLGKKLSEEHKAKLSVSHLGKKLSEETKAKVSAAGKGRILSEGTKAKISVGNKGKRRSEETKAKLSVVGKGRIISEETKAKMSIAARKIKILQKNPNNTDTHKQCSRCGIIKERTEFRKSYTKIITRDSHNPECKECYYKGKK